MSTTGTSSKYGVPPAWLQDGDILGFFSVPRRRTHFDSLSCEFLMQESAINSTSKNVSTRTWWSSERPSRLNSFHVRFLLYSLTHILTSPFDRFVHLQNWSSIRRQSPSYGNVVSHIYPITRTIPTPLASTFHRVKYIRMLGAA